MNSTQIFSMQEARDDLLGDGLGSLVQFLEQDDTSNLQPNGIDVSAREITKYRSPEDSIKLERFTGEEDLEKTPYQRQSEKTAQQQSENEENTATVSLVLLNDGNPGGGFAELSLQLPCPYKCSQCAEMIHTAEQQKRHICELPGCPKFVSSDNLTRGTKPHNKEDSDGMILSAKGSNSRDEELIKRTEVAPADDYLSRRRGLESETSIAPSKRRPARTPVITIDSSLPDIDLGGETINSQEEISRLGGVQSITTGRRERGRKFREDSHSSPTRPSPRAESPGVASIASWHTLQSVITVADEREQQREKIMKLLDSDWQSATVTEANSELEEYKRSTHVQRLSKLTEELRRERRFEFHRFEHLYLMNILETQHNLVELEEKINYPPGATLHAQNTARAKAKEELCMALLRYLWAIDIFEKFSKFKQPGLTASRLAGRNFAVKLREPRYWDSPDSLSLIDLTPPKQEETLDHLRIFLQNRLPKGFLDSTGKEQREVDEIGVKDPGSKGTEAIINHYRMHRRHVSPIVDNLARFLVAIFGGILLLVPMTVLLFVNTLSLTLGVTFTSVLAFSAVLALFTKASNDQILAVTAAYGAVLVVFVANILPVTLKS